MYYLFVESEKSYGDAESHCVDAGGHLVAVTDPGIQAFLASNVEYDGNILNSVKQI